MTISVADPGGNKNTSGTTLAISSVTAAVGTLVCVVVMEFGTTTLGTISDTGSNSWSNLGTFHPNNASGNGTGSIFWSVLTTGLSAGSITYNKVSTSGCAMSGLVATSTTGWLASPNDGATTASNNGSGSTGFTVTSAAAPSVNPEFWVAALLMQNNNVTTPGQDTGHGWATPFDLESNTTNGAVGVYGGNQSTTQTSSTLTFAPTTGGVNITWTALITAFKPKPAAFVFGQFDTSPVNVIGFRNVSYH